VHCFVVAQVARGVRFQLCLKGGDGVNFQQLRSVREAVRRGFNLTEVAAALHTSQPGVSRQIRELEEELGIEIFVRAGKRLTGLTPPGATVLPIVERLLLECDNLKRAGESFAEDDRGALTIVTTHVQARYRLPTAVQAFRQQFARVVVHLHQGSPDNVAQRLLAGDADIGIATDVLPQFEDLLVLPCYHWNYRVLVLPGHPLADGQPLTLARLAEFPLVTYDGVYAGRAHIDRAFERAGLQPEFTILAMNADVIKTYVELGIGVGIVAEMAYDAQRDSPIVALSGDTLFEPNTTHIAVRRGAFLRQYAYAFIQTFAPALTPEIVRRAQSDLPPSTP
jgi:LysR family cys regulon transcriptional activator